MDKLAECKLTNCVVRFLLPTSACVVKWRLNFSIFFFRNPSPSHGPCLPWPWVSATTPHQRPAPFPKPRSYSQWRSNCSDRPGNTPSTSSLHTKCAYNTACTFGEWSSTASSWSIAWTRNTVSGRPARNTAGSPIGSPSGTHLRPVHTFWLCSGTFPCSPFGSRTRNTRERYLPDSKIRKMFISRCPIGGPNTRNAFGVNAQTTYMRCTTKLAELRRQTISVDPF